MGRIKFWMKCLAFAVILVGFIFVAAWGISSMRGTIEESAAYIASMQSEADPVTSFRTIRQQLRAMQKAQLNDIAHSAETDADISAMAQRQLLDLCAREEDEMLLEGVLAMRGWENAVVTVHEDSVNVILQADMVTQQETSVILELVCRETGVQGGNVKIIPVN